MTALSIRFLADHPDAAPVLAQWFAQEWGDGSRDNETAYRARLAGSTDKDRLPICLIGLLAAEPVATATLKFREIEFSAEADFWLGWVCVRHDMRGQGFGRTLVAAVEALAAARGHTTLYLHTPSGEGFYRRLGWQTVGPTTADGYPSTVMKKVVGRA